MRLSGLLACLLAGGALASQVFYSQPLRGISFLHQNSPTPRKHLIETMGGGVALVDYNKDGLLDLYFINSGHIASSGTPSENFDRSNPLYWNRLYRQNRDGSFSDVTQAAGLAEPGNSNYGMGVATGDYDNDGYSDLYVTNYGRNILYHNNGNGTFTDVTTRAGVSAGGWSTSAGFLDFDHDGLLDLFVTRYMQWDMQHSKACSAGSLLMYCPPGEFPATTSVLYRNRGDGTFDDVSRRSGIAASKGRGLGVAFADYDGDGFTDIFVANDGMEQFLFHNNGNGTFTERALDAGVALSDDGKPYAGMGVDFRDYDNDGKPDIIVTNLARQIYALYHNDGGGAFTYASLSSGLGAISAISSGWGVGLRDFDNDGWKDLLVAQGHVMDNVAKIDASLKWSEPPLVALNHQGQFEKSNSESWSALAGRGLAFGDINNDGFVDATMTVLGGKPMLHYGKGSRNHWLTLILRGKRSNRDGMGAVVHVNGQTDTVTSSGSYLSASDKRLHFGLGSSQDADVSIEWPSGIHQQRSGVRADQILEIEEPDRP